MLNVFARPRLSRVLDPVGTRLAQAGVSPDVVTAIGTLGVVGAALGFFTQGIFFIGGMVIWFFVMADMLDGAIARARGVPSRWGAFLDSTLDRVADASIFASLAWWFGTRGDDPWLLAACLIALIFGLVTSYAKARAESLGMACNVGFAERAERTIIVLVGTGLDGLGVPYIQAVSLWFLAAATLITVYQRLREVHRQVAAEPETEPA